MKLKILYSIKTIKWDHFKIHCGKIVEKHTPPSFLYTRHLPKYFRLILFTSTLIKIGQQAAWYVSFVALDGRYETRFNDFDAKITVLNNMTILFCYLFDGFELNNSYHLCCFSRGRSFEFRLTERILLSIERNLMNEWGSRIILARMTDTIFHYYLL